jgi:hypothetical protein
MTLETELLLSTTSNYYCSFVTAILACVPVRHLRFVVEAFDILRTQVFKDVQDVVNVLYFYIFTYL